MEINPSFIDFLKEKRPDLYAELESLSPESKAFIAKYTNSVTVTEAAEIVGLSIPLVRKYCREGKIKAWRQGTTNMWLIFRDDLEAFMEGRKSTKPGRPSKKTK